MGQYQFFGIDTNYDIGNFNFRYRRYRFFWFYSASSSGYSYGRLPSPTSIEQNLGCWSYTRVSVKQSASDTGAIFHLNPLATYCMKMDKKLSAFRGEPPPGALALDPYCPFRLALHALAMVRPFSGVARNLRLGVCKVVHPSPPFPCPFPFPLTLAPSP